LEDPISKKAFTKEGWWSAQGIGPEFKSQYHRKKERDQEFFLPMSPFLILTFTWLLCFSSH
jgi:hypothetical protein